MQGMCRAAGKGGVKRERSKADAMARIVRHVGISIVQPLTFIHLRRKPMVLLLIQAIQPQPTAPFVTRNGVRARCRHHPFRLIKYDI